MRTNYDVVLRETPLDGGLKRSDILDLSDMLSCEEFIPVEFQAEYATSMGFIGLDMADKLCYDYTLLEDFVTGILDDMEKESDDCSYVFKFYDIEEKPRECHIWISRN